MLDNQELRDKLSTAEQKFTTEFFVAMGRHFKSSVLDDLPANYQSLVSTAVGAGWVQDDVCKQSCPLADLASRSCLVGPR